MPAHNFVPVNLLRYFQRLFRSKTMEPLKLLLVDDHPIMQEGVKALLHGEAQFQVKAVASRAAEALVYLSRGNFDIMVSDLNLPDMSGLQLIKEAKSRYPDLKIVVLSMHDEPHLVKDVLKEGVEGYILKGSTNEDLIKALQKVRDGKRYVSEDITGLLMQDLSKPDGPQLLTSREREILALIAKECPNKVIAERLFISERTVETHRKNIFRKTKTNSIVGLIKFAYANQLLS